MRRLLFLISFILIAEVVSAQKAPLVYVLPAVDKAVIVLGDTPANTQGFQVYRKSRGQREYQLMTPDPIAASKDPFEAVQLMGNDFRWISRKMDSMDPVAVWRKLSSDQNLAQAYALLSHGLRLALGRTWVDTEVIKGQRYDYRIVLLNAAGKELDRYDQRIRIEDPEQPPPPENISVSYENGIVSIDWEYSPFKGGEKDRTVGFVVLRKVGDGAFEPLSTAPVLRIEGYLNAFDEKVRFGETYTYAIVALDIIGVISSRVEAEPLAIEDTLAPLVPVGLKATDRGEDVLIIWKMSPELDVSHYDVYRAFSVNEDAKLEKLNKNPIPFEQPRFVDKTAPRGVPVYYRVVAADNKGNESPLSGPATMLAEDKDPPGPVERLLSKINEQERTVELTWRAPDDKDLNGYHVYSGPDASHLMRITSNPLEPEKKASFTDMGYEDRGLEPGRSLVYAVTAIDNSYNESPREILEVKIPDNIPPEPPAGISIRPTREGAVSISWQPILCFDLASYKVYRSDSKKYDLIAEIDKTGSSLLDTEAERGRQYRYYITAIDTSGNESKASLVKEITPTDIQAPAAPTELIAEKVQRGVWISWKPSTESDVKAYRVYRSDYPGGKPVHLVSEEAQRNRILDRDGSEGFVYAVSAIDTSGNESERREAVAE